MQGLWIDGDRPKTKKAVREVILNGDLSTLSLEATSFFGNEYDGPLEYAPDGTYYVVGPDPHTKRTWYASITVQNEGRGDEGRRVGIA